MKKRLLCMTLVLVAILSLVFFISDNPKEQTPKTEKLQMVKGSPKSVGDIFSLPKIESGGEGAPIIAQMTKQAAADDTVIITGKGFSGDTTKVCFYTQSAKDNGKTKNVQFAVIDDTTIHAVVDKDTDYGIIGVYVENSSGKSNIELVNVPKIWSVGLRKVTKGEEFNIYGENLTTDNKTKTTVYLVNGEEYCTPKIIYSDPYKITFTVPDCLKDGKEYKVMVHNGHGGKYGFATADEKLIYSKEKAVKFSGKTIDVTRFGADGKDATNDDTEAISKAINSASDGDIIYFPAGVYKCSSKLTTDKSLKFKGAGGEKSTIIPHEDLEGYIFNLNRSVYEFVDLGFENHVFGKEIKAGFIRYNGMNEITDTYRLKIHECRFIQSVENDYRSICMPIDIRDATGIIIDNNYFDSITMASNHTVNKLFIRNNEYYGNLLIGPYYGQDSLRVVDVETLDISNNTFKGKDILTDDSGNFRDNDKTLGRCIVLQGYSVNVYICNNTLERGGLAYYNAGELILLEWRKCIYAGTADIVDDTTLTLPSDSNVQAAKGTIVLIMGGSGKSQYRKLEAISGKTVTVDEPWNVLPDNNSMFHFSYCYVNIAISNNLLDGYRNYTEIPSASCGLQIYGNTYNLFFTKNTMRNLPDGICITPHYYKPNGKAKNVVDWCIFEYNVFDRTSDGIRYFMVTEASSGPIPGECSIGISIRRNKFKETPNFTKDGWESEGGIAIVMGQNDTSDGGGCPYYTWHGEWINGISIENNEFSKSEVADIYFFKHQAKVVLRNNVGDGGEQIKYMVKEDCNGPIFFTDNSQ